MAAASLQRMVSRHARLTAAKASDVSSLGARRGFGRRGPIICTVTSASSLLIITAGSNGRGGAHWVLIQCMRPRPPGGLTGCAPACDHDLDLLGELLDLARLVEKP